MSKVFAQHLLLLVLLYPNVPGHSLGPTLSPFLTAAAENPPTQIPMIVAGRQDGACYLLLGKCFWEWKFRNNVRESVVKGRLDAYFHQEVRGEAT